MCNKYNKYYIYVTSGIPDRAPRTSGNHLENLRV